MLRFPLPLLSPADPRSLTKHHPHQSVRTARPRTERSDVRSFVVLRTLKIASATRPGPATVDLARSNVGEVCGFDFQSHPDYSVLESLLHASAMLRQLA